VPDAFISVNDNGLAPQHRKNISFRTNVRTSRAPNAIRGINMRVLSLGSVGTQLSLFCGLARLRLNSLSLSEVKKHESEE
jgi:hypothetical protein